MEVENIGDWLYFLFIIIAGISSLFSSKKKKKGVKPEMPAETEMIPEENSDQPEKGFWEILQEMQKQVSPTKPQPKKAPVNKSNQKQPKKTENHTSRIDTQNQIKNIPENDENTELNLELTHASELRKAVIYSEILNRKY
ncbi:MAG: hypothetical protein Q4A54_06475 [Parabacteroides sp.]|nr:hypothetical protein [Parabacteroides sp.]